MKKYITIALIMLGSISFAQPTSGDLFLPEVVKPAEIATPLERDPTAEQAQKPFESTLVSAFKMGNAVKIASYFGDNVDLSILGKANLYSKSQAQQILQHFFTEHKPEQFKIIHKGSAKSSQYFIGELNAEKAKSYRVTINSKQERSKKQITSLTIEER